MKKAEQTWIAGTKPQEPDENPDLNAIVVRVREARNAKKEASADEKEALGELGAMLGKLELEVYKFRDDDGNLVTVIAEQETKFEIKTMGSGRASDAESKVLS